LDAIGGFMGNDRSSFADLREGPNLAMRPNSPLLTDAFSSLRRTCGATKRER
jgi:hypothetical protein